MFIQYTIIYSNSNEIFVIFITFSRIFIYTILNQYDCATQLYTAVGVTDENHD